MNERNVIAEGFQREVYSHAVKLALALNLDLAGTMEMAGRLTHQALEGACRRNAQLSRQTTESKAAVPEQARRTE